MRFNAQKAHAHSPAHGIPVYFAQVRKPAAMSRRSGDSSREAFAEFDLELDLDKAADFEIVYSCPEHSLSDEGLARRLRNLGFKRLKRYSTVVQAKGTLEVWRTLLEVSA